MLQKTDIFTRYGQDYHVPDEWGGMHPKWVRVFSQGFIMRDK